LSSGVILLTVLAGCTEPAQPAPAPPPAAAVPSPPVWVEPPAYTYVLTVGCTRGFVDARYRVTVARGAVTSAVPLEQVARDHPDHPVPTLGELAAWAVRAQAADKQIRYERDPLDGRPLLAGFSHGAMATDAGQCFTVSDYTLR
jgi:hypothetical protein